MLGHVDLARESAEDIVTLVPQLMLAALQVVQRSVDQLPEGFGIVQMVLTQWISFLRWSASKYLALYRDFYFMIANILIELLGLTI